MMETQGKMEAVQEFHSLKFKLRMILTKIIQKLRYLKYCYKGYNIDASTQMERNVNIDRINPGGVYIGKDTIITSGVTINAHYLIPVSYEKNGEQRTRYIGEKVDTRIGNSCVIGVGSMISAGVTIGNNCVVGAHSVVTRDVPDNTIVAGNPARVIKENIVMNGLKL